MSTEHDLEYGPTPPGAQYEHTDINVTIGYSFAVWLLVAMVLSLGLVYGVFWMFEGNRTAADQAARLADIDGTGSGWHEGRPWRR